MRSRNFLIGLGVLVAAALVAFQNCSAYHADPAEQNSVGGGADFFVYPYAAKPKFLADMLLYRPANAVGLSEFRFLGLVSYPANPNKVITYQITMEDEAGATICPAQSGSLAAGESSVEFECVTARTAMALYVRMNLTANGEQQEFERVY